MNMAPFSVKITYKSRKGVHVKVVYELCIRHLKIARNCVNKSLKLKIVKSPH